jgi:hypothetical protein
MTAIPHIYKHKHEGSNGLERTKEAKPTEVELPAEVELQEEANEPKNDVSCVTDVNIGDNSLSFVYSCGRIQEVALPDYKGLLETQRANLSKDFVGEKKVRTIVKDVTDSAYYDFDKMLAEKASKNDVEALRRRMDGISIPAPAPDNSDEIASLKNCIELLKKKIELRDGQIKELECKLVEADKCFEKFVIDNEKLISELSNDHARLSNLHNTLAMRCEEEFEALENAIDKKPNEIVIREVAKEPEVKEKTCNEAFLELFNERYSLADYFFYMTSQRTYAKSYHEMSLYIEECRNKIKEIYGT